VDKEQAEKHWKEGARVRAYLGVESSGDDVESEAEWCQEVLGQVFSSSAKKITICTRSKRWWYGAINERRCQLGREKRWRSKFAATAQAKAELQKSIRRAKDRMWDGYLKNLKGAEVRRAAKFPNPRAGSTVEALTNRDGNHANTISKEEEMLRRESFPPNGNEQYFELPVAEQVHQSVTELAVE
jgi:hypothetical protein